MNWKEVAEKLKNHLKTVRISPRKAALFGGGAVLVLAAAFLLLRPGDIGTAQAALELQQLGNNIRRYYQNRPDFWGLNTQTVLDKKIAPHKMKAISGVLQSSFGTPVFIGNGFDAAMLMPGARSFDVVYKGLSRRQCFELLTYKFDEKFWLGISSVTLNNGDEEQTFSWNEGEYKLPPQTGLAEVLCKDNSALLWHYE